MTANFQRTQSTSSRNQSQNRRRQQPQGQTTASNTLQPPFEPKPRRYRVVIQINMAEEMCVLPDTADEAVINSPASIDECTIIATKVGYDFGGKSFLSVSPIKKLYINFNRYEWQFLRNLLNLDIARNLQSIDIWNATNLTDDQCIVLSKPTLVAVSLNNATNVSDAAFMAFVLNCKGLEYFEVTGMNDSFIPFVSLPIICKT